MGKATKGQSKKADRVQAQAEAAGFTWSGWDGDFWVIERNGRTHRRRTLAKILIAIEIHGKNHTNNSVLDTTPTHVPRKLTIRPTKTVSDYAAELGITVPEQVRHVPVVINHRLKTAAGRCKRWRSPGGDRFEIEINPKCLNSSHFRDTFIHEVAHAVVFDDGHGARFKATCRKMGGTGETQYSEQAMHEMGITRSRRARKVVGTCGKCGYEMTRTKKPRSGMVYKHNGCTGRIVID